MDTEIKLNLFVHIRQTNRQNKNLDNLKKSPQSLCSWRVNLVEEVMAQSSGKKLFLINIKIMWLWFQKKYLEAVKKIILHLVNINVGGLRTIDCLGMVPKP